jgi:hypothetical protein
LQERDRREGYYWVSCRGKFDERSVINEATSR